MKKENDVLNLELGRVEVYDTITIEVSLEEELIKSIDASNKYIKYHYDSKSNVLHIKLTGKVLSILKRNKYGYANLVSLSTTGGKRKINIKADIYED